MSKQKKRIDDDVYTVSPFTGRNAFRIQMRLARLLAPVVGLMAGMFADGKKEIKGIGDIDLDGETLSKVLDGLFSKYSEEELLDLLIMLLNKTEKGDEGKEIFITEESFDALFAQNLMTAFKVAFFVIQVNYPDFFALAALTGNETKATDG